MKELLQAITHLERYSQGDMASVTRDDVMAFSLVYAWVTHYPSQIKPNLHELIRKTDGIRTTEPDRFYKQRRIALAFLSRSETPADRPSYQTSVQH